MKADCNSALGYSRSNSGGRFWRHKKVNGSYLPKQLGSSMKFSVQSDGQQSNESICCKASGSDMPCWVDYDNYVTVYSVINLRMIHVHKHTEVRKFSKM